MSQNAEAAEKGGGPRKHLTTYLEALVHLFKGNVGAGVFALGDAFKNGGIIISPILILIIAVICVHCEHLLVQCADRVEPDGVFYDYPDTVEKCFEMGPTKLRRTSKVMRFLIDVFICLTQFGFCCIYYVFITDNLHQVLTVHGVTWSKPVIMTIMMLAILTPSLITNLKYLAPVSMLANVLLCVGLVITLGYAVQGGLSSPADRSFGTDTHKLALYFGTVLFTYEGIALCLPIRSSMKEPENFNKVFGVLNVGMFFITLLYMFSGFVGYLRWGEEVGGSLTLNLDVQQGFAQVVKIFTSVGVFLGYPLQFFIPVNMVWPGLQNTSECSRKNPLLGEMGFRTFMVLLTFSIAVLVPKLSDFISLVGALCSTALALIFPAVIDLVVRSQDEVGISVLTYIKNSIIIIIGVIGTVLGTVHSVANIV